MDTSIKFCAIWTKSVLWLILSCQFSHSVVSNSLWPHGLQHARLPCPSPISGAYSNSCPLSQWCRPTFSSSVSPFSSCLQSFPASGSFQMSQFFPSGGRSIGVSASAEWIFRTDFLQDWLVGSPCSHLLISWFFYNIIFHYILRIGLEVSNLIKNFFKSLRK